MGIRRVLQLWFLMLMWAPSFAGNYDVPDIFDDPLQVNPVRLAKGNKLPEDPFGFSCPAQADLDQHLALSDAVDIALCNSARVKGAWAAIKAQAAGLGEVEATYLPTVSGSMSRLRSRSMYPGAADASTSTAGAQYYGNVSWRIFDFGGRAANLEAARSSLTAALASHDAELQRVFIDVVGAYFDAITADASQRARLAAADFAKQTFEVTVRREKLGAATRGDSLQAKAAYAKTGLFLSRAVADYQKAVSILVSHLGLPPGTKIVLPQATETYEVGELKDLQHWAEVAHREHPAIQSAKAQWDADISKISSARSEGLPTLDAFAYVSQNGLPNQGLSAVNQRSSSIGFALNVPIFEGFARTYKIRGAQAQAERSEASLLETERQVVLEVGKAHADASSSLTNISGSKLLLEASEEAAVSARLRYARGAADILELLNAQSALADALVERVRCVAEWRSARLKLLATVGGLDRTQLRLNTVVVR